MYDLATQIKIAEWKAKAVSGTLSKEEMIQAVNILRSGRASASAASSTAKTTRKATAVLPDADDLLAEMMGEMK